MEVKNEVLEDKKYIDYINMYIAFILTVLIIILIGAFIGNFVKDELDIEHIKENYIVSIENFVAEQSERMQYIVLTISFPIIYLILYKLLQKLNVKTKKTRQAYFIFANLSICIIILLICFTKVNYSINELMLSGVTCGCICIMLMTLFKKIKHKNIIKYFIYTFIGVIIAIVSYLYVNSTFEQTHYLSHHVDAYYYPILKISSGLTPYIDFSPLYGCYSYVFAFLEIIFKNNSIMFFSIINAILIAIVLCNLSVFIVKSIKNKAIVLVTVLSIIFSLITYGLEINKGIYLQYMPHRVLFISCILLFISFYLKNRESQKKILLQISGFIISTFAMFWNFETGIIVLIVWSMFLGYEVLFFYSLKDKKTYISIIRIITMALSSVLLSYLIILLITYIRTKQIISIKDVFFSQLLFYKDGFFMIKMSLNKPWILLIYIYLIGLAFSLRKLYFINRDKRTLFNKYAIIFVLSILGIGIFSYYQGRSHDSVFPSIIYPGLILIGIFTEVLLKRIAYAKNKRMQILNMVIVFISITVLSLLAIATLDTLLIDDTIHLYLNKKQLNSITILEDFSDYDISNMEFITEYESLYYKKYNLTDQKVFPARVDIFSNDDAEKVMQFLKETKKDVILDEKLYHILYNNNAELFDNKFNLIEKANNVVLLNTTK